MNFYKTGLLLILCAYAQLVNSANATTSNYDKPISMDSRVKTLVYNPNEVFTLVFNYGFHSYIEFAEGETIKTMALGHNVGWKVKKLDNRLFIIPMEKYGRTNLIVVTNKKRTYMFDLICTDISEQNTSDPMRKINNDYSSERDIAYAVRFYYPKTDGEVELDKKADVPSITPPSRYLDKVNAPPEELIKPNDTQYDYRYIADRDGKKLVPELIFDDGSLTYLRFPNNNEILPSIHTITADGKENVLKMLKIGDYIIINGIYNRLILRHNGSYAKILNKSSLTGKKG